MDPANPPMTGNYVREWRNFYDWTQQQLADRIGTDASVISQLESENRRMHSGWIGKLAEVFFITRGTIYDRPPEKFSEAEREHLKEKQAAAESLRRRMQTKTIDLNIGFIGDARKRRARDETQNNRRKRKDGDQG